MAIRGGLWWMLVPGFLVLYAPSVYAVFPYDPTHPQLGQERPQHVY